MEFYRKKRGLVSVPIVPMLDIVTILLIFFIIHTQWKKPQTLLKIDVPGAEYIVGEEKAEPRAVLAVNAASELTIDGTRVEPDHLIDKLRELMQASPGLKMQLDVDKSASFGTIVRIWDSLTAVGIDAGEVPARIEAKAE